MPILSASIVPNITLLVPNVGQDNLLAYNQTVLAYQDLADKIKEQDIETVVIISSRGLMPDNGLAINLHNHFQINFEEFGDLATKLSIASDLELINELKSNLNNVSLVSLNPLDYGSSVPLVYFLQALPHLQIVTIYPSAQGLYKQSELGAQLAQVLYNHSKRIALIASNNLSSRLVGSPLGYLPQAKGYDKKIINGLEKNDFKFLFGLKPEEIIEYYDQGLAPLAMLAGAVADFKKTVKTVSYEYPQGLGSAIINFEF